jgi:hypothetical protein
MLGNYLMIILDVGGRILVSRRKAMVLGAIVLAAAVVIIMLWAWFWSINNPFIF